MSGGETPPGGPGDGLRPNPDNFKDIYPEDEIAKDKDLLEAVENSPNFAKRDDDSESAVFENVFMLNSEQQEWFGESETFGDDVPEIFFTTIPTSKIDDTFNHIDLIGVAQNSLTGNNPLPIGIDVTLSLDEENLKKKFEHIHTYGKSVVNNFSEFGYIDSRTRKAKPAMTGTRKGLKVPGFASAKYFEDTNALLPEAAASEKGRIEVMPRFIIGYESEITDTMAEYQHMPGSQKFVEASERGKWCTLLEMKRQLEGIKLRLVERYPADLDLDSLDEEKRKCLLVARKELDAFGKYLDSAIKVAEQMPNAEKYKAYASQSKYVKKINKIADETYGTMEHN